MPLEKVLMSSSPTCPFCKSVAVTSNGKKGVSPYWRCNSCGEIWNPKRLNSRIASEGRWRS